MFSPLKTLEMIYLRKRPFLLNHKVNIACDCRCAFCNSWQVREDPDRLMSRPEIESLLDQAARAGMLGYSAWGGEPLLREDTPAILAHARSRGFFTTVSTNASLLADRAGELVPYTSLFLVSLDGVGATHDRVRGFPGLFERVTAGVREVRGRGGKVRLFYDVNSRTRGDVAAAARLARELGVSIYFNPVLLFPGYNDRLVLDRAAEREVFEEIIGLKAAGQPILNLGSYLRVIRDRGAIKCRFPRYHVYVDWDGTLYTCDLGPDKKLATWGDCRRVALAELFDGPEFRERTRALADCNACRLSCGEIGAGHPLFSFPVRAWNRVRYEWLLQRGRAGADADTNKDRGSEG